MSYYITFYKQQNVHQITFEDLFGEYIEPLKPSKDTRDTVTYERSYVKHELIRRVDFDRMHHALSEFVSRYGELIGVADKSTLYRSFTIPKKNGKRRQIDAPHDELKRALYDLKDIFERYFFMSYHTSAFAYVKGRSTVDAIRRHQENESKWFLKIDMKDFFPNTTQEFVTKMLCMTFPMCEFVCRNGNRDLLDKALSLCFLRGGLPQGTPISPMLTNAMMIPVDHALSKMCHANSPHLCYTRYADDLLISSRCSFDWRHVQSEVAKIISDFGAPFTINYSKTRYGSSAGSNWNLGLMLNGENQITVGYKKKRALKVSIHKFITGVINGTPWDASSVRQFLGDISYCRMVEKEKTNKILNAYSVKYGRDIEKTAKFLLNSY